MRRPRPKVQARRASIASADVVYEDDHLLIVNKPNGVMTTAERSDTRRSLHDAVLDHVRSNADESVRVRPINHLNRAVSGLVVFAKAKRMETALESLFRRNKVRRTYCAVVRGIFEAGEGTTGTVQSSPDERRSSNRRKQPTDRPSTESVTHFRVVTQAENTALIQLRPETHRKDQLVQHMRKIGHPIVGDDTSSKRGVPSHLLLHLEQIAFEHPRTGSDIHAVAPRPADFGRSLGNERIQSTQTTPHAEATSWQPVAEWYSAYHSTGRSDHFADVIHPGALALIGDVHGRSVLDVACGEGTFASMLTDRGARVVGVDAAESLVTHARARHVRAAHFFVGDAGRLDALGADVSGPFDAATCIMALMNIADLDATCKGISDRLRIGSPFVSVLLHPAFRSPKQTSWGWDTSNRSQQRQYRRVDSYLSEVGTPITMNPGRAVHGEKPVQTRTFHRPLSRYVSALNSAGFVIETLEEWPSIRVSEPGPRADEENRARAEIPLFLGIRAIRHERIDR